MMARRDEILNQARSEDVRTFPLVVQIPDPVDGETIYIEPDADYPFDVIDIRHLIEVGNCTIHPQVDGQTIDTDNSDSSGEIRVDTVTLEQSNPDGSIFEVLLGEALTFDIENVLSGSSHLVVRFKCRRTEVNVDVT